MPTFKPIKNYQTPSQHPDHHPPETSTRSVLEEQPQRKGLLARLRNLQLSRPQPKPEILPDIEPQPISPQDEGKAARRRARREKRQAQEEEWNEEYRQRRNFAVEVGAEMRPLTPLPDFDSASEDERATPAHHPPPANVEFPPAPELPPEEPLDLTTSLSPFLPHDPEANSQPPPSPDSQPVTDALQQHVTPEKARDPKEDATLAEMFGAQAFTAAPSNSKPPQSYQQPASYSAHPNSLHQASPIGWGGVYHSVPSQPMYGTPVHLSPAPRTVLDIDPMLSENIRRGRELAMLAIEQEERGNLGAAEAGYIKALALLVPASKQLDTGSELNKNARLQQKSKIQREAAAMLDRCEELRVFLRANGPAVPSEMPTMPNETNRRKPSSIPRRHPSLGEPPSRDLPPTPSGMAPPASRTQKRVDPKTGMKPPAPLPPPPHMLAGSPSLLLNRLTSRKDVLASASTGIPPDTSQQPPPMSAPHTELSHRQVPRTNEKCFMCSAPAQLRTKCGHSYCSNCGNQAVSVFGQCPVPDCGAVIAVEDFEHII